MLWKGKKEEKRRLKKIASQTSGWGIGVREKKTGLYVRVYPYSKSRLSKTNPSEKKYYKNFTSRKVRRNCKDERLSRCGHKKIFDLWWTLF